jgi:hypothetical protein
MFQREFLFLSLIVIVGSECWAQSNPAPMMGPDTPGDQYGNSIRNEKINL